MLTQEWVSLVAPALSGTWVERQLEHFLPHWASLENSEAIVGAGSGIRWVCHVLFF